ncbi:DUF4381 domain-containing protein [Ruegeria arenilitoris]|uniref:DUF4381 domain-containing protein n=1 Tax=Ruegeria arenilitoris TaxID=1173585 RepID=UPI00147F03F5|nr:DUF4381 domain-containing protein [Ruegeria arenilitoris]
MSVDVEGKSLVELLDMLEPAPVPNPISMMPQTWGWVVLAVLLFGLIALAALTYLRHRNINAYRRQALLELGVSNDNPAKIAEILRRTALVAYPRRQVASLYGENWLNFLRQTAEKNELTNELGQILLEAPYRDNPDNPCLTNFAQRWIRTHQPEKRAR